jgi:hypothetical protein
VYGTYSPSYDCQNRSFDTLVDQPLEEASPESIDDFGAFESGALIPKPCQAQLAPDAQVSCDSEELLAFVSSTVPGADPSTGPIDASFAAE